MSDRTVIRPYGLTLFREEQFSISVDLTPPGDAIEFRIGHSTFAVSHNDASHFADCISRMVAKARANFNGRLG